MITKKQIYNSSEFKHLVQNNKNRANYGKIPDEYDHLVITIDLLGGLAMKHVNGSPNKALEKNRAHLDALLEAKASDTEIIKAQLKIVLSDKDLLRKTLIASGVYNKNLKLTKNYK